MSVVDPPPFLEALREELGRVAEADAQALADGPARRRPRLRLPQLRLALPATVMLLALLAGVGVVASGVLSPSGDSDPNGQVALQNGDDYAPALVRTLSVLRQLPEPREALPPGMAQRGFADAAIRLSPPAPPGDVGAPFTQGAWVVPASDDPDRLLLAVETRSGFGGTPGLTADDVSRGRAYVYVDDDKTGTKQLVGLVPDGVDRVTVRLVNGGSVELPVRDNTFGVVLSVDGGIEGISWSGMAGP